MISQLRTAVLVFGLLSVLTGAVYPAVVTVIAHTGFSRAASGSLLKVSSVNPKVAPDVAQVMHTVGSELIGQSFTSLNYFWGRPSATAPFADNGMAGSGSNLAPTNPALLDAVRDRVNILKQADPENKLPVPVDLVTASASGLDPHLSPAAAMYQVSRVARVRKMDPRTVMELVRRQIQPPDLGFLGQPRVNVLKLNLELDKLGPSSESPGP